MLFLVANAPHFQLHPMDQGKMETRSHTYVEFITITLEVGPDHRETMRRVRVAPWSRD